MNHPSPGTAKAHIDCHWTSTDEPRAKRAEISPCSGIRVCGTINLTVSWIVVVVVNADSTVTPGACGYHVPFELNVNGIASLTSGKEYQQNQQQ